MDSDLKKDYIKTLMSLLEEDKKAVLLYVFFNFSLVSLTLGEKIFKNSNSQSVLGLLGICLLLISGYLFFDYFRKLHLSAYRMAEMLLVLNTDETRNIKDSVWKCNKYKYIAAYFFQISGIFLLILQYLINLYS